MFTLTLSVAVATLCHPYLNLLIIMGLSGAKSCAIPVDNLRKMMKINDLVKSAIFIDLQEPWITCA